MTEDAHGLSFPRSREGWDLVQLIQNSASFADAMLVLDRLFEKAKRVIYAWYQLLSIR